MLTRQELAEKLCISIQTIIKYTKLGYIPKAKTAIKGNYYISVYTDSQYRTARQNLNKAGLYKGVPKGCMTIKMLSEKYGVSVATLATRRTRGNFIKHKGCTLKGYYYSITEFESWLNRFNKPKKTKKQIILENKKKIEKRMKSGERVCCIAKDYDCHKSTILKHTNVRLDKKVKLVNSWETVNQAFNRIHANAI